MSYTLEKHYQKTLFKYKVRQMPAAADGLCYKDIPYLHLGPHSPYQQLLCIAESTCMF